jgi:hypothetical protein
MDSTQHFVGLAAKGLSRLSTLIEQAAALLDERGGRRVRKAMLQEMHMVLVNIRAADNSLRGFACGGEPSPLLEIEIDRMCQVKRGAQPRPALRLVVNNGGDDAA